MKRLFVFFISISLLLVFTGCTSLAKSNKAFFKENFDRNSLRDWKRLGGTWKVKEKSLVSSGGQESKIITKNSNYNSFIYEADVKIKDGGEAGLIFRTESGSNPRGMKGYYVLVNASDQMVSIGKYDGKRAVIGERKVPVNNDEWNHIKVIVSGSNIKFFENPGELNKDAYPKFDITDEEYKAGALGFISSNAEASFDNISISPYTQQVYKEFYQNPVMTDIADPFVLNHDGVYYLYGTTYNQSSDMKDGIKVFTSTDLVHWTLKGWALSKEDSWGDKWFWAPEVVEQNGIYYMYYSVDEHIAVATSKSPLGPFKQDVKQPMRDEKGIDPDVLIDDNGKKYLYFVRFTNGNEIWAAELNDDMKTIKEETLTHCLGLSQKWEASKKGPQAAVNEAPSIIKNNGTYYLLYSANHYQSPDYGVGYATSKSPLGPWTKYPYNPILNSNSVVPGAGHNSIIKSPDGKEMFIVYHIHNDFGMSDPRRLAIDRIHFLPQKDGQDILEVWGPTKNPQPMPSEVNK